MPSNRRPSTTVIVACGLVAAVTTASGCDLGKVTVNTTSKVLKRAQPSLKMEADYDLAARAIPGTLKTIEGFWVVDPDNANLTALLTEGYCQYGTGFVEDEWEVALVNKDFDQADHLSQRATKMFVRCMNYALKTLGKKWQDHVFDDFESVEKMIKGVGGGQRTPLMWVGIALGSAINQNKDNVEMVAQMPTAKAILLRVLELDAKSPPVKCAKVTDGQALHPDCALVALPHLAMGMLYTAVGEQLGGNPKLATDHFMKALEITSDRFLLARVYYARRVGVATQNRELFRKELVKVLQTPPSIWPEQRLANELAHRRARRYLKMEKELF